MVEAAARSEFVEGYCNRYFSVFPGIFENESRGTSGRRPGYNDALLPPCRDDKKHHLSNFFPIVLQPEAPASDSVGQLISLELSIGCIYFLVAAETLNCPAKFDSKGLTKDICTATTTDLVP